MIEPADKQTILVVDDASENIHVLAEILKPEYVVNAALNGEKALKIANSNTKPDLILLDVMMPGIDGYEVCRRLKSSPATSTIPVIFITAKDSVSEEEYGLELGAVDYITKPISPPVVKARIKTHLANHDLNRELARQIRERTRELNGTRLEIIRRLGRAAEYRDNETGLHIIRMSSYSRLIGEAYGGNDSWVELLYNAAPMHDIGKIGIPDDILLKPGKLDVSEMETMKEHTLFGAEIIGDQQYPLLQMSRTIALSHHEKWDGTGYPNGLAGDDIPLEGRIVAIADVFDALTSIRPYKKAWSVEDAVEMMDKDSGHHFDPDLLPLFHKALPEILEIKQKYHGSP